MRGNIYYLLEYSGSTNLQELFILKNFLEKSKNKDKEFPQHFSHRSAWPGQQRMWHSDSMTAEIYSSLFHIFSTLSEGHCNVTEIYAVISTIISSQMIAEIQGDLSKTHLELLC